MAQFIHFRKVERGRQLNRIVQRNLSESSLSIKLDEIPDDNPTFKIRRYLSSLHGRISKGAIATAAISLNELSLTELTAIAEKSTPEQWRAKPGYFRALVDRINILETKFNPNPF